MEEEDEWVKSAMMDASLVAELLMRMKHGGAEEMRRSEPPLLCWGKRKSRSRSLMRFGNEDGVVAVVVVVDEVKKVGELTRASPTTPFSWSSSPGGSNSSSGGDGGGGGCVIGNGGGDDVGVGGGIGGGGGGDFSDESIRNPRSDNNNHDNKDFSATATALTNIRRSRKKKTLAELKEEEALLLKEKSHLRKELKALQLTYEEKKSRNVGLKRMKLDMQSQCQWQSTNRTYASCHSSDKANFSHQYNPTREATACSPTINQMNVDSQDLHGPTACQLSQPPKSSSGSQNPAVAKQSVFVLPDLNMPLEEDSGAEDLYGLS